MKIVNLVFPNIFGVGGTYPFESLKIGGLLCEENNNWEYHKSEDRRSEDG